MKRLFSIIALLCVSFCALSQTTDTLDVITRARRATWDTRGRSAAEPLGMTVAEFRNLPDSDTAWHTLNGTVSTVRNENYGSFYIKDATGEVLIFGLYDEQGMGAYMRHRIKPGDTVSVSGRRTIYDFRVVEMKNATLRDFRPAAPEKRGRGRRK